MLKALGGFAQTGGGGGVGAVTYKGTWNADTNTPTLVSSTGTQGDYYVVNVAGTTNLNGITDWEIGDWAIFNGSVWEKVDNTDAVSSVNGQVGTVVLNAANVGAASNTVEIIAGIGLDGGGNLTANVTIDLANTAVSVGSYGASDQIPVLTIDQQGRITSASNVPLSGTVLSVNGQTGVVVLDASNVGAASNTVEIIAGVGLDGGGNLAANVTIDLANTAVAAGVYGDSGNVSQVTIDAQGRITNASNVAIVASVPDPLTVNDFIAANVTINNSLSANLVSSNTAAMPDPALPLNPEGYIEVVINGTTKKIPYYGV